MTIDEAIKKVQEQVDAGWRNASITAPTVLALLKLAKAWDMHTLAAAQFEDVHKARAAVSEALKGGGGE